MPNNSSTIVWCFAKTSVQELFGILKPLQNVCSRIVGYLATIAEHSEKNHSANYRDSKLVKSNCTHVVFFLAYLILGFGAASGEAT